MSNGRITCIVIVAMQVCNEAKNEYYANILKMFKSFVLFTSFTVPANHT